MKNKHFIKYLLMTLVLLLMLPPWSWAQVVPTEEVPFNNMTWILGNTFLIVGGLVAFAAFLAIFNLSNKLLEIQKIRLLEEHGIEVLQKVGLQVEARESIWQRWYKKAWSLVPMEKEKDILLHHNYDGIRELDNVLPPWWIGMFYASIVFAVVYLAYYHVADTNWSSHNEWKEEMAQAEVEIKAYLATQSDLVDETNVEMLTDASELATGETIYQNSCAACHGKFGEGGVGPNFADAYWIHGGSIKDIFKTVKYGVPEKGMISWKAQLTPANIHRVSSYILTLQGTDPPNQKAPEGELYKEGASVQDSTMTDRLGMK